VPFNKRTFFSQILVIQRDVLTGAITPPA
jgi:hypothetical protein